MSGFVDSWEEAQRRFDAIELRLRKGIVADTFTAATLPAASENAGRIVYVSDGGAGAVFQGSNGTAWVNLG